MLAWDKYVLLAISFAAAVVCYITDSLFAKKISRTGTDYFFFLTIRGVTIGALIPVLSGKIGTTSWFSILFGVLFGVICLVQTFANLKALEMGPFSYTEVIVALSTIIPTLSGLVPYFGEKIVFTQWIGIVLMVICILLSTDKSADDKQKKASLRWLIVSLVASVLNGFVGVMQKIHQSTTHSDESASFLISAFIVWTLVTFIVFIVKRSKKNDPDSKLSFRFCGFHIFVIIGSGLAIGISHVVNLHLSGVFDAAILFPIINVGPLVLTTIAGTIIFKEKLSTKRWIGIVIGIISTLFVSGIITF